MGDMGDYYNDLKAARKERRAEFGVPCPTCTVKYPRAHPTIMLPQQRCRVCGYVDPRPRPNNETS